jgi:uncharacterized protein (DUF58 family)
MTRPTRRGAALLGVALLTYLAARVFGTWELYLVALAFAGMTAVAWVLVAAGSRRLVVERRVYPEQPVAGDPLSFRFTVVARWRLPGLHLVIEHAAAGAAGLPDAIVVEDMGVRGRRPVTVGPRPARRGVHVLPAFVTTVGDPMGLVLARRTTGAPLHLTVVPRLEDLASCAACSRSGARHGGGRRPLPTRDAWEFRSVRPHLRGEPVERVDWKSTAKTGSLMLREMEADRDDDLTVLLNVPQGGAAQGGADTGTDEAFETAVVAAGSIAAFTLGSARSVSLLLPDAGWRALRLTPDAQSRRRLLSTLAEARPQGLQRLGSSLPAILGGRTRPRHRMIVLVTTQVDDDLAAALGRLRRQGVTASVVHVLSPGADAPDGGSVSLALAASGARYFPVAGARDLREALAVHSSGRAVRAG